MTARPVRRSKQRRLHGERPERDGVSGGKVRVYREAMRRAATSGSKSWLQVPLREACPASRNTIAYGYHQHKDHPADSQERAELMGLEVPCRLV